MANQPLLNTYGRLPVVFEHGRGMWLYDTEGQRYLDTFTGIAVSGLGHSHPGVAHAISHQAERLTHCSNLFHCKLQQELARRVCDQADMDGAFFANSGAEVNETAIKLARHYGHQRGITNPSIIVMENAFHGRTLATLTATGNQRVQAGFEPLVSGFVRAPFDDLKAVEAIAEANPNVVAVMVEPIQGEGGVAIPDPDYLPGLRRICSRNNWLLLLDEVQTGNARTGTYLASQQAGIIPDVVTLAKGFGNGYPIGACLARGKAAEVLGPGSHGSTFGGNPLGCAAALAVLDATEQGGLTERAQVLGDRMINRFREHLEGAEYIHAIRGHGLMLGIELTEPCSELVLLAKVQGILLNITRERVIRLLPPLTMTDDEADYMADQIIRIIKLYAADDRDRPRQ
ncbi:aspartate aminotransferase family protein [Salicola sp. Rm-C-2C1-2]|uniref:aspartate aminotransferase family protein n=1 Tax=Salicola sp. Rm-C-2C1-2 TaxID=3141321 RepID=UPI0032E3C038